MLLPYCHAAKLPYYHTATLPHCHTAILLLLLLLLLLLHRHTVAVTVTGKVFAWGCNERGQLGLGDLNDRLIPSQLTSLSDTGKVASELSAGQACTAVLTDKGLLYAV